MELKRGQMAQTSKGLPENFTGDVDFVLLHAAAEPARVSCANVTFQPGARTHWHTHPLGQTLIVTAGVGWTQCDGEPIAEVRAGDVIWCPPGHKHWHGASAGQSMTHIAVQEGLNGVFVEWLEPVSDADYAKGPPV